MKNVLKYYAKILEHCAEGQPGFEYPEEFRELIDLDVTELGPWGFLSDGQLMFRFRGLRERYPERNLIPFAERWTMDDIACWEIGGGEKVFVVHEFSSPGFEQRASFHNIVDWLERATEELLEFLR